MELRTQLKERLLLSRVRRAPRASIRVLRSAVEVEETVGEDRESFLLGLRLKLESKYGSGEPSATA